MRFGLLRSISSIALAFAWLSGAVVHVSPDASTGGDGSPERPFGGIDAAKKAVRELKAANPNERIDVILGEGFYRIATSFTLEAADGGSPRAPVAWKAAPGAKVTLSGGIPIRESDLKPVADAETLARLAPEVASKVRWVDLAALGAKNGGPFPDTYAENNDGILKVILGDEEAPVSRWPKEEYAPMVEVTSMGAGRGERQSFRYGDPTPEKWKLGSVWLYGWWRVEFATHCSRLAQVDPEKKEITLGGWIPNGIGSKFHRPNKATGKIGSGKEPWYAINVVEEIRHPGEWAIDFATKRLYVLPNGSPLELCDLKAPLVSIQGASNLSIEGLRLTTSLGDGVLMSNAENVRVAGCTIRLVKSGVVAFEPRAVETISCDISDVRETGVAYEYVENRPKTEGLRSDRARLLVPGLERVENCHIRNASVAIAFGAKGFPVDGFIRHNLVHDIRGMGILYSGNGMLIEKNELYNLGILSGDVGAIYTSMRITDRGNLVRWNLIHHAPGVNAVYIDDGASGTTATGNVVMRSSTGGWISGGRANSIHSNLFIRCETAALHADDRGVSRGYGTNARLWPQQHESVDLRSGEWARRYPDLADDLDKDRGLPVGNRTGDNIIIASPMEFRRKYAEASFKECVWGANRLDYALEDFADAEKLDFAAKKGSALANDPVYRSIPFGEIGLRIDAWRTALPAPDPDRFVAKRKFGEENASLKDMDASNRKK